MKWFWKKWAGAAKVDEAYVTALETQNAVLRKDAAELEKNLRKHIANLEEMVAQELKHRKVIIQLEPKYSYEQRAKMLAGQRGSPQVEAILDQLRVEWNQYCNNMMVNGAPQQTIDGARGACDAVGLMMQMILKLTEVQKQEEVSRGGKGGSRP